MNKDSIRNNFWGKLLISYLHVIECKILPKLIDDETAVKRKYKKESGKDLNLINPQTYSEKLNWFKLNYRNPLMVQCADKFAVREYIKKKGYGDMLNEVYGVYSHVKDIDIESFPNQFVLKATHGSSMGIIVKDKNDENWFQNNLLMSSWLKQDIYWPGREWVYKDIPKRIIAEKYLEDETGRLLDYKFFCFNGVPKYMKITFGRYSQNKRRNFYDENQEFVPMHDKSPYDETKVYPLPMEQFNEMKKIAADIAKDFPQYVRVDFYSVYGKIYIGELTFFDDGGYEFFYPEEYNYKFSETWDLNND